MYDDFLRVGLEAVEGAKKIVMKYFGTDEKSLLSDEKTDDIASKHYKNPATIADEEAEASIKSYLHKHFPDHGFLGEEEGKQKGKSDYTWIIDPIDGTKAYARAMDDRAILLALQYKQEIIVGISCMPVIDEIVWASKGMGCFLNEKKCHVSGRALGEAFLAHERYKYYQRENLTHPLEAIRSQVKYYIGNKTPRMFHYLVQGKIEAVMGYPGGYFYDMAPYDVMVKEAGGKFTTLQGKPVVDERTSFVASNGIVHESIVSCFV